MAADKEVIQVLELEQEIASIMKYVIDWAGKPAPYYWEVPAHFAVPSAYFPMPEIDTGGETFLTYYMDYAWYIKIFHRTKEGAYALGLAVVTAIRAARNLVPLIAEDGSEVEESWVRLNDPKLKILDDGAAGAQRSQSFYVDVFMKSGKEISDAYAEALERYAIPLNSNGAKPE